MATLAPPVQRGYRGGRYKARSAGSRLLVYGLVLAVALWLIGPFVWLFVTSISYQRNLLARPLAFVPPEVTFENYRMVLGLVRFHADAPDRRPRAGVLPDLSCGRTAEHADRPDRRVLLLHAAVHGVDHEGVLRDDPERSRRQRA